MIEKGKTVKIHYKLTVDGSVIDESPAHDPLVYEHGSGQIIPSLENALLGLKPGDTKEVLLGPDDAYGPINPQAVVEVPKDQLPEGELQIGTLLRGKDGSGRPLQGIIKELHEDKATVDFNHPLAGKELHFAVEVEEIN